MNAKQLYAELQKAPHAAGVRAACGKFFNTCPSVRIGLQPSGVLVYLFGKFVPLEMEAVESTFYRLRGLAVGPASISFFAGNRWAITKAAALYHATLRAHDELQMRAHTDYVKEYDELLHKQCTSPRGSTMVQRAARNKHNAEQELAKANMELTAALERYCAPAVQNIDNKRSHRLSRAQEKLDCAAEMRERLLIAKV